jgi:hypothetical protein
LNLVFGVLFGFESLQRLQSFVRGVTVRSRQSGRARRRSFNYNYLMGKGIEGSQAMPGERLAV